MWFRLKPSKIHSIIAYNFYFAALIAVLLTDLNIVFKIILVLGVITCLILNLKQQQAVIAFSILTKNRLLLIDKAGNEIIARLKFKVFSRLFIVLGLKLANKELALIIFRDSLLPNTYRILSSKFNRLRADI